MSRYILLSLGLSTIVSAAAIIDYRSSSVGSSKAPSAARGPSVASIAAPGVVEGATEEILVRPEVIGIVAARLVAVGDRVEQGQPLVQLDDRSARLHVQAAEAELESARALRQRLINGARAEERDEARALLQSAEARLAQAETSLARITELELQRAVPEQDADDARSQVETLRGEAAAAAARAALVEAPPREDELRLADARIAAAEAALRSAEVALSKTVLTAPCASQVLDINAEVGELIGAAGAAPVVVLSDTSRLRVRAFVEELDAPRVQSGGRVRITADGLPEQVFRGIVATVSPRMAAKELFSDRPNELYDTKVREVLIDVEGGAGMLVGLRVDVWILLNTRS